ncbi:5666_t:CDS:2 [Ambispora leptoticha]|uniref:5666_t:CDS:1 n=1 Tax=Ambispora leptoticha TaxID=144679 RepID=A0A9N9F8I1_9GLOM|nr:5666_t:CDS:2 [Ambispora leptoticha]
MSLLQKFGTLRERTSRKSELVTSIHQPNTTTPITPTATTTEQSKTTPKFKLSKKLHIPFFNNTAKTAPAKESSNATLHTSSPSSNSSTTLVNDFDDKASTKTNISTTSSKKNNSLHQRRQTIIHRIDNGCRRNTIWSDTVDTELANNLSPLELNRQEVLFEIIKTEAEISILENQLLFLNVTLISAYILDDLRLIEELFIQPIKAAEAKSNKTMVPDNLNKVFNAISYFLFIHEVISNCLNERQENEAPLVRSISDILLAYVWIFRAYAPYLIHYEEALRELNESLRRKDKLGKLVKKQQKIPSCRNMPLTTYLLKPFQRLLKYPLLIQNLLKYTVKDLGNDYENTVNLKTTLDSVLQDVEEQKRAHENKERLRSLESRIHGLSGFRLAVDNRQLLREEPAFQYVTLVKKPSLRKSLTVLSSPSANPRRHSVRNLYALECNDIVLLAEKTGVNRNGDAIYRLISHPPSSPLDEEPVIIHKASDSGVFYDN